MQIQAIGNCYCNMAQNINRANMNVNKVAFKGSDEESPVITAADIEKLRAEYQQLKLNAEYVGDGELNIPDKAALDQAKANLEEAERIYGGVCPAHYNYGMISGLSQEPAKDISMPDVYSNNPYEHVCDWNA